MPAVVRLLEDTGIEVTELALRLPSLDEVFLTLTGHRATLIPTTGRAPRTRPALGEAFAQCATLSWRGIVKIRHNPMGLTDVVIGPAIFLVLFGYVFGGAIAGDTDGYL